MLNFLEQVHLLEYFTLAKLVLHIVLLDGLDGHLLASQLVNSKGYLSKGSLTYQFHELVKVQSCWRQFVVLFNVRFYVFYEIVAFLQNRVIHFRRWLRSRSIVRWRLASVAPLCTRAGGLYSTSLTVVRRSLFVVWGVFRRFKILIAILYVYLTS